ncbi:MAG: hypothetical protein GY854_23455 [Deltaproteobacteria bacterium]|nr:hypothetical protein [Deltaproteobacteria bacterium]
MNGKDKAARDIGKALNSALGDGPGESALDMHKRILTASMKAERKDRPGRRTLVLAAAACFAACVALGMIALSTDEAVKEDDPRTPRFKIGDAPEFAAQGSWARSDEGSSVHIVFENGSRFELVDRSSARIVETTPERVIVQLSSGRLDTWINSNGTTEWVVRAGQYSVTVLGTVFSVDWNEPRGDLKVRVKEGRVRVRDNKASRSDVTLQAGYLLSANSVTGEKVISDISSKQNQDIPDIVDEVDEESELPSDEIVVTREADREMAQEPDRSADRKHIEKADTNVSPVWKQQCLDRQFKDAVANAGATDIAEMGDTADLETLWQLAKSARYLKKGAAATVLFRSLRTRFPNAGRARTSAFLIAKTALELEGDKAGARRWFELYLQETGNGSLAEEALGHLMRIHISTGESEAAESTANKYLNRYPGGLFSERAKEILSN